MTSHPLPDAGTLVELTVADEPVHGVRVVQIDDPVLILSCAPDAVPAEGTAVTVRWPAGERGRYVQSGTVTGRDEARVAVELTGRATIEQHRHYVRGGGGEQVLLRQPGQPDVPGWIRDISEQAVRAHFADVDLHDGDDIVLRFQLEHDIIEVDAVAVKVATLRQSIPRKGPMSVEVVALFTTDERQARLIRKYVLHQQMLTRVRTAMG